VQAGVSDANVVVGSGWRKSRGVLIRVLLHTSALCVCVCVCVFGYLSLCVFLFVVVVTSQSNNVQKECEEGQTRERQFFFVCFVCGPFFLVRFRRFLLSLSLSLSLSFQHLFTLKRV
jgi:hypothetical protein